MSSAKPLQSGEPITEQGDAARPRPRDRIVGTAHDLFRKHGIRGVGVDAIADAAGSNKMTLYRHFGSKDDLVVACLREVACRADAFWSDLRTKHPGDPKAQLHSLLRSACQHVADDSRGCDMANAAVELAQHDHPARAVIQEYKIHQRNQLAQLCREAGVAQADLLADALTLLFEGARVSRQSVGPAGPSARLLSVCEVLIDSFMRDDAQTVPEKKGA